MTDILPVSFAVAIFLILLEKIRNKFGYVNLRKTVQTIHSKSVSRYGGIAIFSSLILISFLSDAEEYSLLRTMLLCVSPIFLLGILDDLSINITPVVRLILVFPSAFLSYYYLETEAYSLDIPIIDYLFNYQIFSILFICFAIAGIVNAFNIIDGINGLVLLFSLSICVVTILSGYAYVTDEILLYFVGLFFSILGIFLLNFPFGRIFIGDGGAYFLGAAIAIGLIKIYQESLLSPWYVLLMLIYPVTDIFASLLRRLISRRSTLEPDNKHLHHMILRRVKKMGISSSKAQHSIVTFLTFSFYMPFMLGANYFAKETIVLMSLCLIFIVFYFCLYVVLVPKNFRRNQ
jgi:UDP-GlcNAc:undecaprenyl-phosphate GlcNAc-1-phosphate transferase